MLSCWFVCYLCLSCLHIVRSSGIEPLDQSKCVEKLIAILPFGWRVRQESNLRCFFGLLIRAIATMHYLPICIADFPKQTMLEKKRFT